MDPTKTTDTYLNSWIGVLQRVSVVMAEVVHPATFRTRKLSPPAPMVLQRRRCGRVGHRGSTTADAVPSGAASLHLDTHYLAG